MAAFVRFARPVSSARDVKVRDTELARFRTHYEDLVNLLCDAAHYGPSPKLEHDFARERVWIGRHYPGVRAYLTAYLPGPGRRDDFEALIDAPTLDELLTSDNGCMISRITRTREALNLYGEHLRQLAARIA